MLENLLTNSTFLTIGTVAAILVTLSIFKKLFKFTLIVIFCFIILVVYMINTGQDPQDLTKNMEKTAERIENKIEKVKDVAKSVVDEIEDEIPKDVKKEVEKVKESVISVVMRLKMKRLKVLRNH